jgi:acetaldehyde dehydrogenase (acetylating)
MIQSYSQRYVMDWFATYSASNYQKVAIVGYTANGKLVSLWNPTNPPAMGGEYLTIFQRRPAIADGSAPPR